jgi:hypothetical protein
MSANVVWQRILSFFPELVKGLSGAAPAVDWSQGSVQSITLNAATVTPTFVNPPGGCNLTLVATQDGVGGRAVTWPGSVTWIGGTPPVLLAGAGQTTLVNFYFDGTTYFGWLATAGSPSSLLPWTDVAAGTTLAASLSKPNLAFDTSAAQSNVTLPTAAQMANADGFQFLVKCTGNMLSPVIVNAGAGTTVELLNAPGTFGASTWLPIQGQSAFFKYDKATTQWKVWCGYAGTGAEGTPAYNPGWYARTIVQWDPSGANGGLDTNTGAIGSPVLTWAEVVRRYGGTGVKTAFGQSVQFQKLSAQVAGVDPVGMTWQPSGGGTISMVDTLVVKTAAFVGGAVTARVQATGTRWAVAGFPAGTAAGDYVFNQTRNSYAPVDVGGVTPIFAQPLSAALVTTPGIPTLSEDNTWANGDTYIVYTRNLLNLKFWRAIGGDATAGGVGCSAWVQWSQLPDSSGSGASVYLHLNESCTNVLSGCQILSRVHMGSIGGRGFSTYLIGCDVAQAILSFGSNTMLYGTISRSSCANDGGILNIDGGSITHGGNTSSAGLINWGDAFSDGSLTASLAGIIRIGTAQGAGATPAVWGSASVTIGAMSAMELGGSTWAAVLLTSGALKLGANATGSSYTGNGVMADGVAITAANIATGGAGGAGLQNPLIGARFCNTL